MLRSLFNYFFCYVQVPCPRGLKAFSGFYFSIEGAAFIALVVITILLGTVPVEAAGRQTLHGHVPDAAVRLKPLGRLQSSQNLSLAISLPLRNQQELTGLLQQLNDPSSPNYRHYLTPAQFSERFGPSEADYAAVINFAKSQGLKVTSTHPNRVILDVAGTVPNVEKAFAITMMNYQHPSDGRKFFAPNVEPTVNLSIPLLGISGLDDYSPPQPRLKHKLAIPNIAGVNSKAIASGAQSYAPLSNAAPNTGSGPIGTFMGSDFRTAYASGVSATGSGQTVGLLQFDGYTTSDITYYESHAGLPNIALTNVLLDGFTGIPTGNGGEVEVSLDIEMSMSMAPGLSGIIVYEAGPFGNWHDILNRIATDNLAKQISCSWYIPNGTADATADQIFQQMAAQGQSFYAASGDSDAFSGLIPFPGDTPYITEVGGTTLTTAAIGGTYSSETAWNRNNGVGTGGGISTQYSIPVWQQGLSMASSLGSTAQRNVPDVAMTADNVYVRADGLDYNVGGTSCAAPLWAGFTALINQQAVVNTGTTIGFVNPAVYAIGKGAGYTSSFHDTIVGNNFNSSSPAKFPAVTGYDLCTGWGTPTGASLINALVGPPVPTITTLSPLVGAVAGTAYTQTLSASGGTSPYTWSIFSGSLPAGLGLSTGGVISGTPTTTGTASFAVQVTDSKNVSSTTAFTLTVSPSGTPVITTTSPLPVATVSSSYSQTLTASGGATPYVWSIASGALPVGLSLNSTGTISGTPASSGAFTFTAKVTATGGLFSTTPFSLTVNPAPTPPAVATSSPLPSGAAGSSYSQTLTANGGTTPYTWSLASGALPTGLSLSSAGVITGIPTGMGTSSFTVMVTSANTLSSTQAFVLTIYPQGTLLTNGSFETGNFSNWVTTDLSGAFVPLQVSTNGFTPGYGLFSCAATEGLYSAVHGFDSSTPGVIRIAQDITVSPATPLLIFDYRAGWDMFDYTGSTQARTFAVTVQPAGGGATLLSSTQLTADAGTVKLDTGSMKGVVDLSAFAGTSIRVCFDATIPESHTGPGFFELDNVRVAPSVIPVISTSSPLPSGSTGNSYSVTLAAVGGTTPYTWSTVSGSLPNGLTLTGAGQLSGVPTTAGTASFILKVLGFNGQYSEKAFSLNINASGSPPTITTTTPLPSGFMGSVYSQSLSATGGVTPYTWTLSSGSLPLGLSLSSAGLISGTPTSTGTSSFTVKVTGADGQFSTKTLGLTISAAPTPPTIASTSPLPSATAGSAYSQTLLATGGTLPYVWSLASGSLPTGLVLSTGGVISGTTTVTGTSSFTIRVTGNNGLSSTAVFSLTVNPAPIPPTITTTSPLPSDALGTVYNQTLAATGGVTPYTWTLSSGTLPPGLHLGPDGVISGTPTVAGTSNFVVTVTGADSGFSTKPFSLAIGPGTVSHFAFSTVGATQYQNVPFTVSVTALDIANNIVPGFTGPVTLSGIGLPPARTIGGDTQSGGLLLATQSAIIRSQYIYLASEVGGASQFTSLAIKVDGLPGQTLSNWTIRMKETPLSSYASATWDSTGWTTLYQANQSITATGWVVFTFSQPFNYDGLNNLMMDFSFRNSSTGANGSSRVTSTTQPRMLWGVENASGTDPLTWSGTTPQGSTFSQVSDIQLTSSENITISPSTSGIFTNGVWSGSVTVPLAISGFQLGASDSNGNIGTSNSFNVTPLPVPTITSAASAACAVGQPFSYQITATANPTSFGASGLPGGLTVNTATGVISGTPTSSGAIVATITATNAVGTGSASLTFGVQQQPSFTDGPPPSTLVSTPYSFTYTANGFPFPTFSVTSGSLPPGLSLTSAGLLSGTPTTTGTYSGVVTASNGISPAATQAFSIVVQRAPTITSSPLAVTILQNQSYNFFYSTNGYPVPTFSLGSGSLPPGLTLSTNGALTGTPTQLGSFSGTVVASNGVSPNASQTFSITVVVPSAPVITSTAPTSCLLGSGFTFAYKTTGFPIPTFTLTSGSLPPGLTLNSAGMLSGTPTQLGTYSGTVTASNGVNPIATQNFTISVWPANSFVDLHDFSDGSVTNDGAFPTAPMTQGPDGNFYGVTLEGGSMNDGCVYKMTPQGVITILHSFCDGTSPNDGSFPEGGLTVGADGSLYGTTNYGHLQNGSGTFYKITTQGTFTTLHYFANGTVTNDGKFPEGPLVLGSDGNFYGTTTQGGSANGGTIYKITALGAETILHHFNDGSVVGDGQSPEFGVIVGADGNFYGVTNYGGTSSNFGTIFKMTLSGTVTILHRFGDGTTTNDGTSPRSGLVQASDGNFYGTTYTGGSSNQGVIFKMTSQGVVTLLHLFNDGTVPGDFVSSAASLIQGADGNLYGTSLYGGAANAGGIFEVTPQGAYTILHSSKYGTGTGQTIHDMEYCATPLFQGSDGNLYGTSFNGGVPGTSANGFAPCGIAFKVVLDAATQITSANNAVFFTSQSNAFTVTAGGTPAPTFSATGLPSWATLNSTTGVLSGTPTDTSGSPYSITITASNGVGANATQAFILTVATRIPVINPVSPVTAGNSNTISWSTAYSATQYEIQASTTSNFATVTDSGWISSTSYTFNGLTTGTTYYYRVRGRSSSTTDGTWSQTSQTDFGTDTLTNATTSSAGVILSSASGGLVTGIITNPSFESSSSTLTGWTTSSHGGQFGEVGTTLGTMPTNGTNFAEFYSSFFTAVTAGDFYAISQSVNLTGISSIQFDAGLGLASGTNNLVKLECLVDGTSVWSQTAQGNYLNQIIDTSAFTGTHTIAFRTTALSSFASTFTYTGVDNLRTYSSAYQATGTVTSTAISPASLTAWGILTYASDVTASGTALTVDVLSSGGTLLASNVSSGVDLSTLPPVVNASSFKLRANLSTSNTAHTPKLSSWSVGYFTTGVSAWSGSASSTQGTVPSITNGPPTATALVGGAYNFTFTTTGTPTPIFSVTAGALPTGLNISSVGVLSGTPTAAGTFTGTITASNGIGTAATQDFSIVVGQAPSISNGPPPAALINAAYNFTFTVTGSPTPTFAVTSGTLPPGLSLSTGGVISGTPTTVGTYTGTITASNGFGTPAAQNFSIVVQQQPILGGSPAPTIPVNVIFSYTYQASVGYPAPTYSVFSGLLPPGLTLTSAGVLSGTPTVTGNYSFTVRATNSVGSGADPSSIEVYQVPAITNGPPQAATLNIPFAFSYVASGYPAPTFSVTAGALPPGLIISSAGVVSGTPTTAGTYTGTVKAVNGFGVSTQNFSIDVQQAPSITDGPPPATVLVNTAYNFTYTTSGYPAPTFSVTAGALPMGLTLSSTGVISGTPTATGTYTGTVSASNGIGTAATQNFTIAVQQTPSITNGPATANATVNAVYNFAYATSGYPVPTFSVTAGALPPGLVISSAGLISGAPTTPGVYTGTVTATNGIGTAAAQNFSISVFTSLTSWDSKWFTAQQLSDPTISGPNAMPENDGISNLYKYVFDIDPMEVMTAADRAALPAVGTMSNNGVLYLTLTYRENPWLSGVTITVQTSSDLHSWQTVTPAFTQSAGTDSVTGDPLIEFGVDVTHSNRKFIQLNVTTP